MDLRGLRAFITLEDDDLVMVVHDGDQSLTFETGAGGSFEDAIRGAEQLADQALQFANLLKVRAGSWRPLTRLIDHARLRTLHSSDSMLPNAVVAEIPAAAGDVTGRVGNCAPGPGPTFLEEQR
jgi:hypothetical protein